jgi:hypothetical protein
MEDLVIVGGGFAGLACARTAALRGLRVCVLERRPAIGVRTHTTGIVVKEAAEEWEIPPRLSRRIAGVRLYAPSLRAIDLDSPGYYFLATDTPRSCAGLHVSQHAACGLSAVRRPAPAEGGTWRLTAPADALPRQRGQAALCRRSASEYAIASSCSASSLEVADVRGVDPDQLPLPVRRSRRATSRVVPGRRITVRSPAGGRTAPTSTRSRASSRRSSISPRRASSSGAAG